MVQHKLLFLKMYFPTALDAQFRILSPFLVIGAHFRLLILSPISGPWSETRGATADHALLLKRKKKQEKEQILKRENFRKPMRKDFVRTRLTFL